MSSVRRILYPGRQYLLRDDFNDDRAAGALNGVTMPAVPGPGMRTGVDTEGKLSISGEQLVCAGGKAVPVSGDPGLWDQTTPRAAGRMLISSIRVVTHGNELIVGWDTDQTARIYDGINFVNGILYIFYGSGVVAVGSYSASVTYQLANIQRTVGYHHFIKGGVFTTWRRLFSTSINSPATVYPGISNYDAIFTVDYMRILACPWLPPVLAHDTMTRADGAIGNTESAGPDNQGAPILAWTGATWTIATNKAINTPVAGGELLTNPGAEGVYAAGVAPNWSKIGADGTWSEETTLIHGDLSAQKFVGGTTNDIGVAPDSVGVTSGIWYLFSAWVRNNGPGGNSLRRTSGRLVDMVWAPIANSVYTQYMATGRAISTGNESIAGRQAGTTAQTFYLDDFSLKALTLSELIASVQDVGTPNVVIDATLAAYTEGTQAGIVARLDSAAAPANFIIANQDGANVKITECVAGVYTSLASVASAFAASNVLRLDLSGANYRLYKITSAGVATLISASTTNILTSNLHGMFDTLAGAGNAFSKFTVMQKAGYSIPE